MKNSESVRSTKTSEFLHFWGHSGTFWDIFLDFVKLDEEGQPQGLPLRRAGRDRVECGLVSLSFVGNYECLAIDPAVGVLRFTPASTAASLTDLEENRLESFFLKVGHSGTFGDISGLGEWREWNCTCVASRRDRCLVIIIDNRSCVLACQIGRFDSRGT